jgi:hypothetical protein
VPAGVPAAAKPETGLTLARAFQLMTEALGEFRGAVTHEQLRSRMAAMYGKEDELLDPERFPRLLRQANDAEIADVRTSGENEYEISLHRRPSYRSPEAAPRSDPAETVGTDGPPELAEAAPSPARRGVRFRRGSRSPQRPAEIPLIGVVKADKASGADKTDKMGKAGKTDDTVKADETGKAVKKPRASKSAKAPKAAKAAKSPRPRARKASVPKAVSSSSEGAAK